MAITDPIAVSFVRHVSAVPEGLTFLLTQCIANEEYGEGGVFVRLAQAADDPWLRKVIERHRSDEQRHARMLRQCVKNLGADLMPVPLHLDAVAAMDRAIGAASQRSLRSNRDVMDLYLALLVLEERAATQFPLFARAVGGTEIGRAMDEISVDEMTHVRFCRAVARRYADNTERLDATLRELRAIEERTFRENSLGNLEYLLDSGWVRGSPIARVGWRAMAAALRVVSVPMHTPHAGESLFEPLAS